MGDVNERVREKTGYSIDELNLKLMDGSLTMEILNKIKKDDFSDIMSTSTLNGKNFYENLSGAKDRLDEKREEITEKTLKDILDEGDVIDKGSEQDEYDALFDSFEEIANDELVEKKSGETGETITYHEEQAPYYRNRVNKFYTNSNGNYTGVYEVYDDDILVGRTYYDDNGNILSGITYDKNTGTPEHHGRTMYFYTYTDGNNIGSIQTTTTYYYRDEDIAQTTVLEQPEKVYQIITEEYDDSDGRRSCSYYGDWYEYDQQGHMTEHSFGSDGQWQKTEGYDAAGKVSYDRVYDSAENVIIETDYYTACPADWTAFDPTDHPKRRVVYPAMLNDEGQPVVANSSMVRSERWVLYAWEEDKYQNYGYRHYDDWTWDENPTNQVIVSIPIEE